MVKPAHERVTWSGVFGSAAAPVERWSFGVSLPQDSTNNAFTDAQYDALAGGARDAWDIHLKPIMPASVLLTEARFASVDGAGKVERRADGSYKQGILNTTLAGTASGTGQVLPLQTALVVSLDSARAGATGKGRFFLPWPARTLVAGEYRLSAADAAAIGDAAAGFLSVVNLLTPGKVCVASSKGYTSEVISLRVGRVPDTMRSRRTDALEAYFSRPLAPQ